MVGVLKGPSSEQAVTDKEFSVDQGNEEEHVDTDEVFLLEVTSRAGSTFCPSHGMPSAVVPVRLGGVNFQINQDWGAC